MMDRLSRLREALQERGLDVLVVTQPENRRYLSGYRGETGALVISPRQAYLVTDFRFTEQAEREAPLFQVVREDRTQPLGGDFARRLLHLLQDTGTKRVGFEGHHITLLQYQAWAEALQGLELVSVENLVEGMRAVKDEAELAIMREAVALTDSAYGYLRDHIRPGLSEKEVAWETEVYMRTHGAEKVAFDLIIAAGPNGAMPHARASERIVREGEPIVIDMGACLDGYHSDLTRTICLGQPDPKFLEMHHLVRRAQERAEEGIRAGMGAREADGLARRLIEEAGYGERFGHGLGHGVGLAIHEAPAVNRNSEEVLRPGMVITVEPGIYIPGWGGVRIEDMAVIGEDGVEVLTRASKEPLVPL